MLPLDPEAKPRGPGGPLWFPRPLQGTGRHDNPELYGCLYLALEPPSAVAEALRPFSGSGNLSDSMLQRGGRPLSLVRLHSPDEETVIDLDEPGVLREERLRPSAVATRRRSVTQEYAARLYERHPDAAGLRWWSTLESSWINVTLFDRCSRRLRAGKPEELAPDHPAVIEAAELLGLM